MLWIKTFFVCVCVCTFSSQNWQGRVNTHLIWWSVTEDSLMHAHLCSLQWPSVAVFHSCKLHWYVKHLFLYISLQKQGYWKWPLKAWKQALLLFYHFIIPWLKFFTVTSFYIPFFWSQLTPTEGIMVLPSWSTDNWVVLFRSVRKRNPARKLLWKYSPLWIPNSAQTRW